MTVARSAPVAYAPGIARAVPRRGLAGVGVVALWELEKLAAQLRVRLAFAVCLVGPFVFAAGLEVTGNVPADTLFGRWVAASGYATPLVVLGFAAAWGFPILTCLVAGDIFAAEDHYGTWPMLLTRSRSRGALFAGKLLAVVGYVVAALVVLTAASVAAGVAIVGTQPLVGLSGTLLSGGHVVALIVLAWLTVLLPCLGFAAIGVLLSVLTRNSLAAIIGAVVLGLAMQFGTLIDGIEPLREALLGTQFLAWHGLFAAPQFLRPVALAQGVAAAYLVVCLTVSWLVLRRRDVTGG